MPTFRSAKLVRDNIPGWHRENGHTVVGRQLSGAELQNALCQKLHEEADEVSAALTPEELVEEIGDVQQIINDLCSVNGISKDTLEAAVRKKTDRKGGFLNGEYIDTFTVPSEDDEWAQYARRSPEKYPEIKGTINE